MTDGIRLATRDELKWLNNGFDEEVMTELEAAYLQRATRPSPTPPQWRYESLEEDDES